MDSTSLYRGRWKVRLVAFVIGILVAAAVFGIALGVSDDLRLLYVSGALLLAFAAFLLGAPTLVLWVAIVVWLLFRKRFAAILTMAAATILIAVSAWYCTFYIPVQMGRTLTQVRDGAAPPFTLQPVSQGPVSTRSTSGKILVLDFFAT